MMHSRIAVALITAVVLVAAAPSQASAYMQYAVQADYANRTMATGVASQVYTYPQILNNVGTQGAQATSIYAWVSGSDYIEVAYNSYSFPTPGSDLLVAWEKVGETTFQEQYIIGDPAMYTWYNFQIYSNDGTRYWKAGKNNSVYWQHWMNFSTALARSSSERESVLDTNYASFHNMQYREYMSAWALWASTHWHDEDPIYSHAIRSSSSWYMYPTP